MKKCLFSLIPVAIMILGLISIIPLPASATNNVASTASDMNSFAPSDPTFNGISPNSGSQGQALTCTITGWYIGDANAVVFSGTGVTAGTPVVVAANEITVPVTIAATAPAGLRNITIYYNSYSPLTQNNAFTVIALPPVINSVNPNSGRQGQTVNVTINGANFNGPVIVSFSGGDITVNSITVNSGSQLTVNITIANTAMPAERYITINAFGGTSLLDRAFTVNAGQALVTTNNSGSGNSSAAPSAQAPVALTNVVTSSASLSSTRVAPGTPVTVTANIVNKSAVNGSTRLTLYVNGQEEASQGVTVNSGSSTPVIFTVTRNEPGTYTVYVGGINAGSFVVDELTNSSLILYISIVLVAIAFVIGLFLIVKRRQPGQ